MMTIFKWSLIVPAWLCTHFALAQAEFSKVGNEGLKNEKAIKMAAIEKIVAATRNYEKLNERKDYTLFAPNNAAFKKVPLNTIEYFLTPTNADALDQLVDYHVLEGKYSYKSFRKMIGKNKGFAIIETVGGVKLMLTLDEEGEVIMETDAGRKIRFVETDYNRNGGIVHVVDQVIIPYRFLQ
jgi:uncharacterized surface protein with fasciclin (FAS1) repeats